MGLLLFLTSLFMILLVLVQRGKGGGLTGALGGMGGQSAFGAKAGDAFTRITVGTAIFWILLCMLTIAVFNPPPRKTAEENPASVGAGAVEDEDKAKENSTGQGEDPGEIGDAAIDNLLKGAAKTDDKSDKQSEEKSETENNQDPGDDAAKKDDTKKDDGKGQETKNNDDNSDDSEKKNDKNGDQTN